MVFLIMGGVGFLILALSFLFDGLFDVLDLDILDNGILSVASLASFTAFFGFTGYFCVTDGLPPSIIAAASTGMGAIGFCLAALSMYFLKQHSQPDNAYDNASLVGRTARVVSPALAGQYATVTVEWNGIDETVSALADYDLHKGDEVTVIQVLSSSAVRVEKALPLEE